jgi:hypothetical protein
MLHICSPHNSFSSRLVTQNRKKNAELGRRGELDLSCLSRVASYCRLSRVKKEKNNVERARKKANEADEKSKSELHAARSER